MPQHRAQGAIGLLVQTPMAWPADASAASASARREMARSDAPRRHSAR